MSHLLPQVSALGYNSFIHSINVWSTHPPCAQVSGVPLTFLNSAESCCICPPLRIQTKPGLCHTLD
uniref:Uncharacterized protein n=1 Tax=Equus asinus TaxID=9793 RepID=A0A9L0J0W6_EQUAS